MNALLGFFVLWVTYVKLKIGLIPSEQIVFETEGRLVEEGDLAISNKLTF